MAKKKPKSKVVGTRVNEKGQVLGKNGKPIGETPPELTPYGWKKGQSGNPKGRPKKEKVLTHWLKEQLGCMCSSVQRFADYARALDLDPDTTTIGALLSATVIDQALTGGHFQMREVFNRSDGIQSAQDQTGSAEDHANDVFNVLSQIEQGKPKPPVEDVIPKSLKEAAKDAEIDATGEHDGGK